MAPARVRPLCLEISPSEVCNREQLGRGAFASILRDVVENRPFAVKCSWRLDLDENDSGMTNTACLRSLDISTSCAPRARTVTTPKRRRLLLPLAIGVLHARCPLDLVSCGELVAQLSISLEHMHMVISIRTTSLVRWPRLQDQ